VKFPVQKDLVSSPTFNVDPDGKIIYRCGLESFAIDATAGTWERCEWMKLGHGFEASQAEDWRHRYVIRYLGEEIGRLICQPYYEGLMATADGYLAIKATESDKSKLEIWSLASGKWTTLDEKVSCVAGWMNR
jgi:hypothetical protein